MSDTRAGRSVLLAVGPPVLGDLMSVLLTRTDLSLVVRTEAVPRGEAAPSRFDVVVTSAEANVVDVEGDRVIVLPGPDDDMATVIEGGASTREHLGDGSHVAAHVADLIDRRPPSRR